MKIGIMPDLFSTSLSQMQNEVSLLNDCNGSTYWIPQIWRYDALTLIPKLHELAPSAEFASAVVATYLRHPMTLASQALTTNLLTKGHFTLGIGVMHKPVIENSFKMKFEKPHSHMQEYLDILLPLLNQKTTSIEGKTFSYEGSLDIPEAEGCDVMLAALGPKMLELCAKKTSGTILWMTGPNTIKKEIVPTLQRAAPEKTLRVAAMLPVFVTDDIKTGRRSAAKTYALYSQMPSYRKMLDKEGTQKPEDYVLVGSEDAIIEQLSQYKAAGVTDCGIQISPSQDRDRAMKLISTLPKFFA